MSRDRRTGRPRDMRYQSTTSMCVIHGGRDSEMSERDYQRFLRDVDGVTRLHVKLLPRATYVAMVHDWRARLEVIQAIADEGFWLWDYNERLKQLETDGVAATPWEVAEDVLREMDDREWWTNMERFEEHLITHAPERLAEWAELLDPVYDEQERDGWILRQ